jgi:F0F1-type ATP synthase membrane subunit a
MAAFHVPFLAPLLVVAMELLVSFLQAFVFALLVLIYFKMAEESH